MIETFHLGRTYGAYQAVQNVSLQVATGEMYGFLGLNGAGKTTVMRMICGLLRPTDGFARVGPITVRGPQDTHRLIPLLSFVSQEIKFFEQATLGEMIALYARLVEVPADTGLQFARQAGVPLDRPCGRFSPGQQRKAQLAIALLKQPRYLLLDEPTAGLDPQGVNEMRDLLRALNRSGTTIFFSSHVLSEVQSICTRVGILHCGQLCYQGKLEEAYQIEIPGNPGLAGQVLQAAGIQAAAAPAGLRVSVNHGDLPAVIQCLVSHGILIGQVQPDRLEDIFQNVIGKIEAQL